MSRLMVGITASATFVIGGALGYLLARKHLSTKFDKALVEEIEATKNYYTVLVKGEGYETPADAVRTLGVEVPPPKPEEKIRVITAATALSGYQGKPINGEPDGQIVNIFKRQADGEVPESERRNRTEEAPYIISHSEFHGNDLEYQQSTITYYAGDAVLADEQDEPIEDVDATVGLNNLTRFGEFSDGQYCVYVRNDARGIDYQILGSDGKYAVEVAGFTE